MRPSPKADAEFELRACAGREGSLACAGVTHGQASIRGLCADGAESLLEKLDRILRLELYDATLPRVAARLGMSSRSLQRHLRRMGTSFRRELETTRVREAKRRMRTARLPLTTIALDLGFASIQGFGRSFFRSTGVYPRAWRNEDSAARASGAK